MARIGQQPFHFDVHRWMRELLGPNRIIGLHATETGHHWVIDLTGNAISWRPGDEPAAADLRGPVTDLLLGLYRRVSRPSTSPATPVWSTFGWSASASGDVGILVEWST